MSLTEVILHMETAVFVLEMVGTVAFALSGVMVAL